MQKKSSANFLYRIGVVGKIKTLLIWDRDQDSISVTNDIENVVADIGEYENIDPVAHAIIYRDSEGYWTGWDAKESEFYPFPMPLNVRKEIAEQMDFNFELPQP